MPKLTMNSTAENAGFRFPDPRGELESEGWPAWRRTAATALLVRALCGKEAFWRDVESLAETDDPEETGFALTRGRAQGKRRDILTDILLTAAEAPDRESAYGRLLAFSSNSWVVQGEAHAGRPHHYGFDPQAFIDLIGHGAALVARRWARECFECGERVPADTSGDYCRRHDGLARRGAKEADRARHRAIRRLFEHVRPPG